MKELLASLRTNTHQDLFKSELSFYKKKVEPKEISLKETTAIEHLETRDSLLFLKKLCVCSSIPDAACNVHHSNSNASKFIKSSIFSEKNVKNTQADHDILKMYM